MVGAGTILMNPFMPTGVSGACDEAWFWWPFEAKGEHS